MQPSYDTVKVEITDSLAWVSLNRPEKRNAMNPAMHLEMVDVLQRLEFDSSVAVLILTGEGESWCAGQDLKEMVRDLEDDPARRKHISRASHEWRWKQLWTFPKPTIAMVNGYCFGAAFTQLVACDFAFAAEEAIFGISEINWGTFPAGVVPRVLAYPLLYRDAIYYIMTGETFNGRRAAEMRLVTRAVPRAQLREETGKFAATFLNKNPVALRAAKEAYKLSLEMTVDEAEEYIATKSVAVRALDTPEGRERGLSQFIDEKGYRPGLQSYEREKPVG